MTHDPLCPSLSPQQIVPVICTYCQLIRAARQEEREAAEEHLKGLIGLAEAAYVRGREDAAVDVREFPVHSVPFVPSDTPLSMAVRVKEVLSIAAMGVKQNGGSRPDQPGL